MTLLQMKAIVLAVELGSISLAAKQLNVSQSNVSAYIRDIEEELGVKLLVRSRKGISATEQGNEFIEHAKTIFAEQEAITNINKLKQFFRLRVGAMHFNIAKEVFNKLCIEHADDINIDLHYSEVSLTKGIELLKEHRIDVMVGFIRDDLVEKASWIMGSHGLEKIHLGNMPAYIRLRKDHPCLTTGINKDGSINLAVLKGYTYIDFDSFKDDNLSFMFNNNFEIEGIHQIYVADENSRNEIISKTNCYCMGAKQPKEIQEKYGFVCLPINGLSAEYCVLIRKNDECNPIINNYINLIKEKGNVYLQNK